MFIQLLESYIPANTTWYISTLTSEPSVPDISVADRRFWYGDSSSNSFKFIKRTNWASFTFIGVQLKGEFFQFKIFRFQLETFQFLHQQISSQAQEVGGAPLPPTQYLKIIRENQRAVPEKVQDKSEKNSIPVYENSSFGVAEKRVWLLCEPLC